MARQDVGPPRGYSIRRLSDDELAQLGDMRCTKTKTCLRAATIVVVYAVQSPESGTVLSEDWYRCDVHGRQMADVYGLTIAPAADADADGGSVVPTTEPLAEFATLRRAPGRSWYAQLGTAEAVSSAFDLDGTHFVTTGFRDAERIAVAALRVRGWLVDSDWHSLDMNSFRAAIRRPAAEEGIDHDG
jgi:hypothetical protein